MNKEVDKDYEELVEKYEDALIRLVMYRVAQEDGKRLLKEAEELEQSGFEVPKELDEKCLKLIKESCASEKRRQAPAPARDCEGDSRHRPRLRTVGRVLTAAILAAMLLFCVAYASNEQFRIGVLNFFIELRENGTWFSFHSDDTGNTGAYQPQTFGVEGEFPFEFTYIPERYELFMQDIHDAQVNGIRYFEMYTYPDNEFKHFSLEILTITEGLGLLVDTEDASVKNVNLHGHDGQIIQKIDTLSGEPEIIYVWFDLEERLGFIFTSMGISLEESQKIFDGIVISEQF